MKSNRLSPAGCHIRISANCNLTPLLCFLFHVAFITGNIYNQLCTYRGRPVDHLRQLLDASPQKIEKREDMNRICIFYIVVMFVLAAAGCSAPDQYPWIPWHDFQGHCTLKLNIAVETVPDGAEVLVDGDRKGTTPCSFVYEATQYIRGEKRGLPRPEEKNPVFETRETEFLGETVLEIVLSKQGFKPVSKALILEDYFLSDSLDHRNTYEKSLKLSYKLKEE